MHWILAQHNMHETPGIWVLRPVRASILFALCRGENEKWADPLLISLPGFCYGGNRQRLLDSGRDLHQYHSQSQNQFHWNGNRFVCTECSRSSSGKAQHCLLQFHVKWNYITYLRSFDGKKFQNKNLLFYVSYCSVATQTMMTSGRPYSAWIYRYSDFASEGWSVCGQYLASIL